MPQEENAYLYFKQGSSDKVYNAHLLEENGNWVVTFEFGRRGSTLSAGTKGCEPNYNNAKRIYDALVSSKIAKGYQPGEGTSEAAVVASGEKVQSGLVPQLPTMIDEEEVEKFIVDDDYLAQEKFDGKHLMIKKEGETVTASNKKGIVVGFPSEIQEEVSHLEFDSILDGEAVGTILNVFDVLQIGTRNMRDQPCQVRSAALKEIGSLFVRHLKVVYTATGTRAKRNLLRKVRLANGEGLVFKRRDAIYTPGKPSSGGAMRKFKFYGEATCQVLSVTEGKRSIEVGVHNGDRPPEHPHTLVSMGKVTIPPNHSIPSVGNLVDIKYLYAYPDGALFQSIYKGTRDDVDKPDLYSSLKFKAEMEDEDGA